MLDIRLIREKTDYVKERLTARDPQLASAVDEILECDRKRRAAETRFQQLQSDRKRISKEIGMKRGKGEDTSAVEAEVRAMGDEIAELENSAKQLESGQRALLLSTPNLPHADCPRGHSAEDNPVVRTWGEKPAFDFAPQSHIDLGAKLTLFDFERAAKIAGSAFTCFTGAGARLQRALINFLLDLQTREHGYTEVSPPFLVNADALVGTTQLPKFEEQLYRCERDDLY